MPIFEVRVRSIMIALLLMMLNLAAVASNHSNNKNNNEQNKTESKKNSKAPSDNSSAGLAEKIYTANASQYVGAETCKTCHEEQAKGYEQGSALEDAS